MDASIRAACRNAAVSPAVLTFLEGRIQATCVARLFVCAPDLAARVGAAAVSRPPTNYTESGLGFEVAWQWQNDAYRRDMYPCDAVVAEPGTKGPPPSTASNAPRRGTDTGMGPDDGDDSAAAGLSNQKQTTTTAAATANDVPFSPVAKKDTATAAAMRAHAEASAQSSHYAVVLLAYCLHWGADSIAVVDARAVHRPFEAVAAEDLRRLRDAARRCPNVRYLHCTMGCILHAIVDGLYNHPSGATAETATDAATAASTSSRKTHAPPLDLVIGNVCDRDRGDRSTVGDEMVAYALRTVPRLRSLNLSWAPVSDATIRVLASTGPHPELESLDVSWSAGSITADALVPALESGALPNLRAFSMAHTRNHIGATAVSALARHCPHLAVLDCSWTALAPQNYDVRRLPPLPAGYVRKGSSSGGAAAPAAGAATATGASDGGGRPALAGGVYYVTPPPQGNATQATTFHPAAPGPVATGGAAAVAPTPFDFAASAGAVTLEAMAQRSCLHQLAAGCGGLRSLSLQGCLTADLGGLLYVVAGCPLLQALDLSWNSLVSDAFIERLVALRPQRLRHLDLMRTGVSDTTLESLQDAPSLRSLVIWDDLKGADQIVTARGVKAFLVFRPDVAVGHLPVGSLAAA